MEQSQMKQKKPNKKQKGALIGMLFSTFGVTLLGNLLVDKNTIRAGEGTNRADQDF